MRQSDVGGRRRSTFHPIHLRGVRLLASQCAANDGPARTGVPAACPDRSRLSTRGGRCPRAVTPLLTPSAQELAALSTAIAELNAQGMWTEAAAARRIERKVRALIPEAFVLGLMEHGEAIRIIDGRIDGA